MKKSIIFIVLGFILIGAVLFILLNKPTPSSNNGGENTEEPITQKDIITLEMERSNDFFSFNRLDIDPNTKTIRLYFGVINSSPLSYLHTLYIYDENGVIGTYNINLYEKSEYIDIPFTENLDNATNFSLDLVADNATTG